MFADFNWLEAVSSSPILILLIACSIVTLGVTLERALYFWRRRGNPAETLAKVQDQLGRGELKEAAWTCQATPHPLGKAAEVVLADRGATDGSGEERLHIALSEEKLLLEKNLGIIGTMAAVAPLIGLLGTVYGIMLAFHDMGVTGSSAPSVVAAGVAEALLTTGAGLVVAVPALVLYNQFIRRMNVMLTIAENSARIIRASLHEKFGSDASTAEPASAPDRIQDEKSQRVDVPAATEV